MKEKLQQLMKSEGLTSSRMAEILGIQPSGISHILAGRNKPGFDLLQKILRRFPRVNPRTTTSCRSKPIRFFKPSPAMTGIPSCALFWSMPIAHLRP